VLAATAAPAGGQRQAADGHQWCPIDGWFSGPLAGFRPSSTAAPAQQQHFAAEYTWAARLLLSAYARQSPKRALASTTFRTARPVGQGGREGGPSERRALSG